MDYSEEVLAEARIEVFVKAYGVYDVGVFVLYDSIHVPCMHTHVLILTKSYPHENGVLLHAQVTHKGNRIYKESDRRHHKSDGLIFQPDAPYVFGTDVDLVKWKWPELVSSA